MEISDKKLLNFVADLGALMIKNGAEMQRTEKTIMKIAASDGIHSAAVFVVPTSIMVTLHNDEGGTFTEIKRIPGRRINLEKVIACDMLAVEYIEKRKSIDECIKAIDSIDSLTDFKVPVRIASYSLICMAITILFRGTLMDGLAALFAGVFQGIVMEILGKYDISVFLSNAAGSAVVAAAAYIFYIFGIADNYNSVILGSLMPLVPGFAATNAVRDLLYGYYVSGNAKLTEALVTSIGIATGVITTLWLFGSII